MKIKAKFKGKSGVVNMKRKLSLIVIAIILFSTPVFANNIYVLDLIFRTHHKEISLSNPLKTENLPKDYTVRFEKGWQCYNCKEIELQKKRENPSYKINLPNNDAPLEINQTEKTVICPTCSKHIKLRLTATSVVLGIKVVKE